MLTFVREEEAGAVARVVFYHQQNARLNTAPVAVFAVRIESNSDVRSGDDESARVWSTGGPTEWARKEREKLGYEIFLGQIAANERFGQN